MLYFTFRFEGYEDSNGDYVLISIDGVKGNWTILVDGKRVPINKYIPPNGTTVLFQKVWYSESVDAVDGRLLKYFMNQNFQLSISAVSVAGS